MFDLQAQAECFQALWRAAGVGSVRVTDCRRTGTRYEPGTRCVATYDVRSEVEGRPPLQTIGVVEVEGDRISRRLLDGDPDLPGLRQALDSEAIQRRLAALPDAGFGYPADHCRAVPVAYRRGQRCVLRYELGPPGDARMLFGKLYAQHGSVHADTLAALNAARADHSEMPLVARPLAFWPDLELVLQAAVPDAANLTEAALTPGPVDAVRVALLRRAGGCLAALHTGATEVAGPPRTIIGDLEYLADHGLLFAQLSPDLVAPFGEAIDAIDHRVRASSEPDRVPSHGALRTDQFLVGPDGGLGLVDFDGFCWANPARDAGNLLAYLEWRAVRRPQEAASIERARDAFLEGYAAGAIPLDELWLDVYRAVSMLKIAGRRLRRLSLDELPFLPALLERVRQAVPA